MTTAKKAPKVHLDKGTHPDDWDSYTFKIGKSSYFLPHTRRLPYWELMLDDNEEYVSVASGAANVKAWLDSHGVKGIPVRNTPFKMSSAKANVGKPATAKRAKPKSRR